jgi:MFS family permease
MSLLWFLGDQKNPLEELLIVLLTFTVITIKLSAAPVILFFVWFLVQFVRGQQWRKVGWVFVLAGLVFIPWCVRSVVMTGYLVYPIPFPDIFTFDWKIPAEHLIIEQDVIRSWGKIPAVDFNLVKDLPFMAWAKPWFFDFSLNRKMILALVFLFPLFLPFLLWKMLRYTLTKSGVLAFLVTGGIGYTGLLYWFFSAPDIRFGYTFIVPLLSLILAFLAVIFIVIFKKFISNRFIFSGVVVLTLLFTSQMFVRSINSAMINQYGVYPADYPSLPTYPCEIYNKTILCAELYNECWYAPFPCIPTPKPQAVMRGEDIRSGFRLKN